jgi:excisionase family DNA binding protein
MKTNSNIDPPKRSQPQEFYSLSELATATGTSRATLYREEKEGKLKFVRIRGRTLVRKSEWQRFLRSLNAPPPADPYSPETTPEIRI